MTKEKSQIIRGIAILLMLAYHLHYISDSYVSLIYISEKPFTYYINNMANPVSFYIVLSGYGLSYIGQTSWDYKIRKILILYITYWLTLILFPILLGSIIRPDKYPSSFLEIFMNFTGYITSYNKHNWFLFPYIVLFLLSGYIQTMVDRIGIIWSIVGSFLASFLCTYLISIYQHTIGHFMYTVLSTVGMTFTFVAGMIMERLNRNGKLRWNRITSPIAVFLILSLCFVRSLFHTHAINSIFAITIVYLLIHVNFPQCLKSVLFYLGKYSMPIWFIHGYFLIYLFHDYLIMLRYPLFIYLVVVLVSLAVAVPLNGLSIAMCKKLHLK